MKKALFLSLFLLGACAKPTLEEIWVSKMLDRCYAMHGSDYYDKDSRTFECFRAPFGRMTKTLFKETFNG